MRGDTKKLSHLQVMHGMGPGRQGHIDTRVPLRQSDMWGK